MKQIRFMLIAGEASGDLLAAELVTALKQSPEAQAMPYPPEFFGAGGPQMAAVGVELAFDLTQHSVIGLSDALKKYWQFKRIFDCLLELARKRQPDVIICVDFQAFNRRFAHAIKECVRSHRDWFHNWNPKIAQYVSPQVWASRPGRAYQLAQDVDLLLSIIPFEKDWYAARVPKLRVEFVGHPVVDRFPMCRESKVERREPPAPRARQALDARLSTLDLLILLLPGSRMDEVRRHLPVVLEAARRIRSSKPDARFRIVLPSEELKTAGFDSSALSSGLEIRVGGLAESLAEADLAITKSGTVTLECALLGVPAVVFYKTSWPTYLIGKQIVNTKHIAMPNLLAGEAIYPEFIQHAATPENIAREALNLLNNLERQAILKTKLAQVVKSLGEPGASRRAAQAVWSLPG